MAMFLKNLFASRARQREAAGLLYVSAVEKARDPVFYVQLGVPDTLDGRFDLIVIHVMLVLRALRRDSVQGPAVGQEIFGKMIQDMDRGLREMGVGDMGVGRQVKKMAKAFYGRAALVEEGLNGDNARLEAVLAETVFRNASPAPGVTIMANYLRRVAAHVEQQPAAPVAAGTIDLAVPVVP
jgi:cytochrome b pre-mRNA-processing protein 3